VAAGHFIDDAVKVIKAMRRAAAAANKGKDAAFNAAKRPHTAARSADVETWNGCMEKSPCRTQKRWNPKRRCGISVVSASETRCAAGSSLEAGGFALGGDRVGLDFGGPTGSFCLARLHSGGEHRLMQFVVKPARSAGLGINGIGQAAGRHAAPECWQGQADRVGGFFCVEQPWQLIGH
jgi:hypothetical protein